MKQDEGPRLAGVSLSAYAGIIAARSAGLPIEPALERAGVDPLRWPQVDSAWSERLAQAALADHPLFGSFLERTADERLRLPREASPATDARAAAPPSGGFTLAHYAALCAELAAFPGRREEVFARYGLATPTSRADVDRAFQIWLHREHAARQECDRLYRHYRGYFASRATGGAASHAPPA